MMKKTLALFLSIVLLLSSVISTAGAETAQAVTEAIAGALDNITITDTTVDGEAVDVTDLVATEAPTQTVTEVEPTAPTVAPTEAPTEPAVTELSGTIGDHTVTVTGKLPAGATLELSAVDMDSAQQIATDMYKKEAVFACDIKIFDADGNEWQPDESVTVEVSDLTVGDNQKLGFLHIAEDIEEVAQQGNAQEVVEDLSYTNENGDGEPAFSTTGFSTFIGYTVDFHYAGMTHSILGEGSILLSELFTALSIDKDATTALKVEFTDYDLLSVAQQNDGDWLLTSLKAFQTEEVLTITLPGEVLIINVTDATYSDGAVVDAQTITTDQTWNISGIVTIRGTIHVTNGAKLTITGSGTLRRHRTMTGRIFNVDINASLEIRGTATGHIVLHGNSNGAGNLMNNNTGEQTDNVAWEPFIAMNNTGTYSNKSDGTGRGHLKLLYCDFTDCRNFQYYANCPNLPTASCVLLNGTRSFVHIDNTTFTNIGINGQGRYSSAIRVGANFDCGDSRPEDYTSSTDGSTMQGKGLKIRNCAFTNCYADAGGAIFYSSNYTTNTFDLSLTNFTNCGAVNHGGGAVYFGGDLANWDIYGCVFDSCSAGYGNSSYAEGGGICLGSNVLLPSAGGGDDLIYTGADIKIGAVDTTAGAKKIGHTTIAAGQEIYTEFKNCVASTGLGGAIGTRDAQNNGTTMNLTINRCEIYNCSSSNHSGGGIAWREGTLTVNQRAEIHNNSVAQNGGGIYVSNGATLINNGNVYENNAGNYGGGICATNCSKVEIGASEIFTNTSANGGGGVWVENTPTFTMNGTYLYNNHVTTSNGDWCHGGGLLLSSVTNATLTDTVFGLRKYWNDNFGNTSVYYGGAIYAKNSSLSMTGGGIYNSSSSASGGGILADNTPMTLSGVTIHNNTTVAHGGAIWTNNALTLTGCVVSNNKATSNTTGRGAGAYVEGTGEVTINGGTQFNSNASGHEAGGLYVKDRTVTIDNAHFNGNSTLYEGGGIYASNCTMTMSGGSVHDNQAKKELRTDENKYSPGEIEGGGGIFANGCKIDISDVDVYNNLATSGIGGGMQLYNCSGANSEDGSVTIKDCNIYGNKVGYKYNASGELEFLEHHYGGGIAFWVNGTLNLENTNIYNNIAAMGGGLAAHPSADNNNKVVVNLKGVNIYGNTACGKVITAGEISDTYGGGVFIQGKDADHLAILNLESGTIGSSTANQGNSATIYGGGVAVWDYATFNMNGGTIIGNTAGRATADNLNQYVYDGGAGVYVSNTGGTMNMTAGTISNNTVARYGGHSRGGGIYNRGKLTITGGTISNNTAINGGGIANFDTASISNATIHSNYADNGGGVFSYMCNKIHVLDCDVYSNTCHDEAIAATDDFSRGGGIFVEATTDVKVNGCKIYSNTAHEGGGVYILDSFYNDETKESITHAYVQNCYIYNNTANGVGKYTQDLTLAGVSSAYTLTEGRGGGVYLSGCNTADLSGSKIGVKEDGTAAGNKADTNGGGVYVVKGNFTLTSGEISNNKAGEDGDGSGGGIYFSQDVRIINEVQYIENGKTEKAYSVIGSQYYHGDTNYDSFAVTIANNSATVNGGGVYTELDTTSQGYWDGIKFCNSLIENNSAGNDGGGVYSINCPSLTINSHSIVKNNTAGRRGGAVCAGSTDFNTDYARFEENTAAAGGGIFARNSQLYFWAGSELINNDAIGGANDAISGAGGGLYCYTSSDSNDPMWLYVYNLKVSGNTATTNGGGIYLDAGTQVYGPQPVGDTTGDYCIGATSAENPEGYGIEISNNTAAQSGGGMYSLSTSALRFGNAKISGNTANNGHGGGLYITNSPSFMLRYNSEVSGNLAKMGGASRGGGVYLQGVSSSDYNYVDICNNEASYGGGIYFDNSNGNFWAGTDIYENTSAIGGAGIYVYAGSDVNLNGGFIRNNTATGTGGVSPYNVTSGFSGFGGGVCVIGESSATGKTAVFRVQQTTGNNNGTYNAYVFGNTANYAADDIGTNIYGKVWLGAFDATEFKKATGIEATSWYTDYTSADFSTTQRYRISWTNADRYRTTRPRLSVASLRAYGYDTTNTDNTPSTYAALTLGVPLKVKITVKYYGRNYDATSGSYADISQTASKFSNTYTLDDSDVASQIKTFITKSVVDVDKTDDVQYALINNALDEYICYTSQSDALTKSKSAIHTNWYDQAQTYDTEQWVTYKSMGTVVEEGNDGIDEVIVWLRNDLKEYDYSFNLVTDKAGQIGDNGVAYGNTVSGKAYYNQRLGFELGSGGNVDENTTHLAGHGEKAWLDVDADTLETVVQNGKTYTFSHWSTKADGSDKFSTERLYRNRIISDLTLYAVYTTDENAEKKPGLTAIKGLIETYNVDSTAKTAINTIMNPYNCEKSDPKITQVGVVYVLGDINTNMDDDSSARTQILDKLAAKVNTSSTKPNVNGSFTLTDVTGATGANCRAYYSFAGSAESILTNRNRLQFTEVFTTSTLSNKRMYAYVAMYYEGFGWILSDNNIDYQFDANGAAK